MVEENDKGKTAVAETKGQNFAGEKAKFNASTYLPYALIFVFYLVIALVMFYPITLHMGNVAPGTGADTYQNLWDVWWTNYAVFTLHTNVFYSKLLFWPIGINLAYVTLSPLLGVISAPFQAFGTVFGYNVMFFLGFALSGLTMYILADHLTKNRYAALVAGFIFTFSAFHIAQSYSHIHFTNIEWIPLFVYFLIKIMEGERKWTNVVGMSVTFALTTLMGNIEQTLMLAFVFIILVIIYAILKETRKHVLRLNFLAYMAVFVVLALLIGSWNFIPLFKAVANSSGIGVANYLNTRTYNLQWSISPASLFIPSYYNGIVYSSGVPKSLLNSVFSPDPVERVAYIGYLVMLLALFGIYKYGKKMLPWLVCAAIFLWLAMGPNFGLYAVYHAIPGINVIREPGRFDLMATMFIAIIAAYGSKALFEQYGTDKGKLTAIGITMVVVIIAVMFLENNGMHVNKSPLLVTNVTVPALYYQLANFTGNFSILGLPTLPAGTTNQYMYPGMETYYTSVSHKPLVGGYTGGRQNISSTLLLYNLPLVVQTAYLMTNGTGAYPSPINENYTNQTLLTLFNYNTDFVIVHKNAFSQGQLSALESYLIGVFGNPVYNDNTTTAFETLNAINRTLFKSFVSYPVLTHWSSTSLLLNGTSQTFWIPSNPGDIVVYAPYPANTTINVYETHYTNTTISFVAFSNAPQKFYIAEPTGVNSTSLLAAFNVTTRPERYTATVSMVSGGAGNILYFLNSNNNSPVLIKNITFSR